MNASLRMFAARFAPAWLVVGIACLWSGLWPAPSLGQLPKGPLELEVLPVVPRARSQSPLALELNIKCESPQLFEGELHLSLYVDKQLVQEYRSDELAITLGGRRFRIMLPPVIVRDERTRVTLFARFQMSHESINLGDGIDLSVPTVWKRAFVVVAAQPLERIISTGSQALMNALVVEQFSADRTGRLELRTNPARMAPRDFPAVSAAYAAFDMLLLEGDGLNELRDPQLRAIGDWVAAGGSVLVRPDDHIPPRQVEFLNRLAGAPARGTIYGLDESGRLTGRQSAEGTKFVLSRYGLGRAVIVQRALDPYADFVSLDWLSAVTFLWKVREDQCAVIAETGKWKFTDPQMAIGTVSPHPFAPERSDAEKGAKQLMIPARVQGIPFRVVAAILIVFLVAIAPGDFFLLGLLKRRRYTWVLFGVLSLGFTFFTARVANYYLGNTDYRSALVIADIGPDASIVRTSRYELTFTATPRTLETPLSNSLFVPIEQRKIDLRFASSYEKENEDLAAEDLPALGPVPDLPVYAGHPPSAYTVSRKMRQWSPQLTRTTTFGSDVKGPDLDWRQLHPEDWSSFAERAVLRQQIDGFDPTARVLLFHRDKVIELPPASAELALFDSVGDGDRPRKLEPIMDLIKRCCVRSPRGLFALVSQISPTGNDRFEDLALVDESDPGQWLLVMIIKRGDELIVYRRLYTDDSLPRLVEIP